MSKRKPVKPVTKGVGEEMKEGGKGHGVQSILNNEVKHVKL